VDLPIILIVLLAVFGSGCRRHDPVDARRLHGCGHDGPGLPAVDAHHHVGVRDVDGGRCSASRSPLTTPYSILMRFREELRSGRQPREAVDAAMATSGPRGGVVRLDGHCLAHRHLPDQHPGAEVDGHGRDPRGRGGDADVGTLTPAVLATFARAAAKRSALLHCRAPGKHPISILDPLGRVGDAAAVVVGGGGSAVLIVMGPRNVDGDGEQLAAPVRLVARDPLGGGRSGPGARPARWALSRCWSPFRRPASRPDTPDDRRDPSANDPAPNVTSVAHRNSPTTTAARWLSAVLSSIPRPGRPADRRWMRANYPIMPARPTSRRWLDRADQGLRRPGCRRPSAGGWSSSP